MWIYIGEHGECGFILENVESVDLYWRTWRVWIYIGKRGECGFILENVESVDLYWKTWRVWIYIGERGESEWVNLRTQRVLGNHPEVHISLLSHYTRHNVSG